MGEPQILTFFRQLPAFSQAGNATLALLSKNAVHYSYKPDEVIFWEGEQPSGLIILEKGSVKAFKTSTDGQEYIWRIFGPGDMINLIATLDERSNIANTLAVTSVEVWIIPVEVFRQALHNDLALSQSIIEKLVTQSRELVNQLEDLALRPITSRLARFLLEQINHPSLSHPAITRVMVANHLATTPESISRSLRHLETAGAIQFNRHRIVIVNLEILRRIAQL